MEGLRAAILLLLCYLSYACSAQEPPDKAAGVIDLPSGFFNRLQSKAASLNSQLTKQTEKYLDRMARREAMLPPDYLSFQQIPGAQAFVFRSGHGWH